MNASEKPSPYSGISAFAANPLLISLEKLVEDGLLTESDIQSTRPHFGNQINLKEVSQWKSSVLHQTYQNYKTHHLKTMQSKIDAFIQDEEYWLDRYTLYMVIKSEQNNRSWSEWPQELKQCDKKALESKRQQYADLIHEQTFLQFIFFQQWNQLKQYANKHNVIIYGGNWIVRDRREGKKYFL